MIHYFTKEEKLLWILSALAIIFSFARGGGDFITLVASLIGITSILFDAKGNPFGQILMVIFSLIYGIISYSYAYYGEMITYLGMTMPMAVLAFVAWMRHPYKGDKSEVEVATMTKREYRQMTVLAVGVTVFFYFVLRYFDTANLYPSTLSVTTSFVAVYLTYKRSHYFSIAYAANDVILIVLWVFATWDDVRYASVAVCFVAFLANDLYAYYCWRRMGERQRRELLE
ncbi:nicotinamide mononucleotide transporter PnuC [Aedoeadaptatus coxii]|uniref:Nicotinamide mononucleotide transporter PnuC n=1 Tax=Aedoeadaptatus coxii TaxID=755172 RepID=A0A134AB37_9FIRM|nr:nicotinamide riboside transporter PnuC [Peptoniphilus coxii]KXB64885.1 nicotinamide mononucleotide transporter PnuC [Peptoniphilus coxii]